ncbi:ankyrin repeat protein [Stylonychia lemnae]|uniref:Ankyrin repeat protein n=1 Tax=Stylonychia lemnae TaxID=5949 RepID=A0A077ZVT2_STYLE|nr:ankyrin repeat protein [Stylonychia lemnae]|eukprot:CDW74055.1 ankyrin repeat protein [Stylonychia lemnae]
MMRQSRTGFYLDPIQQKNNQIPGQSFKKEFDDDRMEHLENENELLKIELKKALDELQALREENLNLKSQLKDPSVKIKPPASIVNQESTFITKGSENPTIQCDNCTKEIDKKNFDLHVVYCLKNITRCPFCKQQVDVKELQSHIEESAGSKDDVLAATINGDLEKLKIMQLHGQDLRVWVNENESSNSVLHYAVKNNKRDIVDGFNIDQQNQFGETALHWCSGQNKNIDMVKVLILKGANSNIKNQLGDSSGGVGICQFVVNEEDKAIVFQQSLIM